MKVIRASEIGTYKFCNRAWWYQLQGYVPDNQIELERGKELHTKHFFTVTTAGCMQIIAYGLVIMAILSAIIWLIQSQV